VETGDETECVDMEAEFVALQLGRNLLAGLGLIYFGCDGGMWDCSTTDLFPSTSCSHQISPAIISCYGVSENFEFSLTNSYSDLVIRFRLKINKPPMVWIMLVLAKCHAVGGRN
jgi:hypothetical protein